MVDDARPDDRTTEILSFWTAKGGVGASVTAAAVALLASREHGEALLVDLRGDQLPILGLASNGAAGLFDWLESKADRRQSIERLSIPTSAGLHLVQPGAVGRWTPDRVDKLIEVLMSFDCPVVIDCGLRAPDGGPTGARIDVGVDHLVGELCRVSRSVLVSSSCYLAVRRAVNVLSQDGRRDAADLSSKVVPHDVRADLALREDRPRSGPTTTAGLVVISDPGRALEATDVASVTQLELLAHSERDPAVARCVDAGMFLQRPPRSLLRSLGRLL